ncbi:antitoxin Xre/MbcA/ParS toxin-binding domain-containing protein [Paucibacter sp. B51]|uniref:antitoxin Xre/MbcA/ParS toxin-binding domain-containing protein n=1 Tax=Paucibacter sp. B51 TaxID=2993315 RepID=UPI003FA6ABEF
MRRETGMDAVEGQAPSYRSSWSMAPVDRIAIVQAWGSPGLTHRLARDLGVPQALLCKWLNVSPRGPAVRTRAARIKAERLLGLAKLVGEVEQIMLESSYQVDFDAARWVGRWLTEPQPALGGAAPCDYVDCGDGRELLSTLLRQQQSGAYL